MDRLERLVVHVAEAIRLGTALDDAHLRLGLMLLDSAAELLMHRECRHHLSSNQMWSALLRSAEETYARTGTDEDKARAEEARAKTISRTQRKRIERGFDAKCDFLREKGLLADPQVRVLKKLHQYRNETYHRDKLRSGVLATSARIYIHLVCTMMLDFPVHGLNFPNTGVPPGLTNYLSDGERFSFDTQAKIGARLLEETGLATQHDLGLVVGMHVHERLDVLEEAAEFIASWYREVTRDESWDLEAVLGAASLTVDPVPERRRLTADLCRSIPAYKPQMISDLRELADGLRAVDEQVGAFALFANLEDILEPLEARVVELADWVDGAIQYAIDVARGK